MKYRKILVKYTAYFQKVILTQMKYKKKMIFSIVKYYIQELSFLFVYI